MSKELKRQTAIEPEIINERGENLTRPRPKAAAAGGLGAVVTLAAFMVLAVIIAIPVLILSLFGKKPNIKIFKFKL